jgi:ABC-2 type transport system permease protein
MNVVATPISQGLLFQRLRGKLVRNAGTHLFGNSRVRFLSMIASSVIVWLGVFGVGYAGFDMLASQNIPPGLIVELVFNAMFATLGGMLVFSTGLVLYAGLFNGAETRFLLTTPARADQIFAHKFHSALGFSSWAFVVLGAPILIAYGIVFGAPWYYYVLLPVFFLGYVLLPGGVGAVLCLVFVNFFPHRRKQAFLAILAVVIALAGFWIYRTTKAAEASVNDRDQIRGLFGLFTLTRGPASPSDWMSRGLLDVVGGRFRSALLPLALIWTNGLLLYVVAAFTAKHLYRRGYNRMSTGGDLRHRYGSSLLDRLIELPVFYLDRRTRILIVKDFRTFRRDPAQMGQVIIFTGLLLLAVLNTRGFFQADVPLAYQHGLSLLNMSATGLLMCAYLGRFVYPLISLEGKKFWILGLLPVKREQLLLGKFAFAVTGSSLLATLIIVLSDGLLGMSAATIGVHLATMLMLAFGLSGLSVGISAWLPNFPETDASKIVLGFGGTVNMLACLGYLVVIIGVACGPYHGAAAASAFESSGSSASIWAFAGLPVAAITAAAATLLPLRIGARHLRGMEF